LLQKIISLLGGGLFSFKNLRKKIFQILLIIIFCVALSIVAIADGKFLFEMYGAFHSTDAFDRVGLGLLFFTEP
jgi:MFS-type transporter involved in bile tolerance (Atg22 family)